MTRREAWGKRYLIKRKQNKASHLPGNQIKLIKHNIITKYAL